MIDHVCVEVRDLERSARFYDAVFFALGVRRMLRSERAIAYGIDRRSLRDRRGRRRPTARTGHLALAARGPRRGRRRARGRRRRRRAPTTAPPAPRPGYGNRAYAGDLLDPDGIRIVIVSGGGV